MGDGKASSSVAIGIDLGTTYSCVAVWRNDRVEIITNDQGNRITPSCVAFNDTQRMIGDAAKNQIAANPTNTVFEERMGEKIASSIAIGIDLGTTYSCVAVWRHDGVEIITNDQGNRITPSCVAFNDTQRMIGDAAKNQIAANPTNTVFDSKRLIGRKFSEPHVQNDMKLWPFQVTNVDEIPMIIVEHKSEKKSLTAEEISSMILAKMREIAEQFLGTQVTNAVITVPAYFNDSQRQATKDAGQIAGLNVLSILNEPSAAAIAYGLDTRDYSNNFHGIRTVFVFDFGGGTLDLTLLTIDNKGNITVKIHGGDTHLGGQDFDAAMVEFVASEFQRKKRLDLRGNKRAICRLKVACERAKRILSSTTQASIELESLHQGIDFYTSITRAKFEEINKNLFERCMELVNQCFADSNTAKQSVDEVVLVGGSTRIPKLEQRLKDFFDGKDLCKKCINADEAVAYGAAIHASKLSGDKNEKIQDLKLWEVTPLSLGVEVRGSIMNVIIPRNTVIPTKKQDWFTTTVDNQTIVTFHIYEGERKIASNNNLLGSFDLEVPPAPRGASNINVCFEVDSNGILHVSAEEIAMGWTKKVTVVSNKGRLSREEVERMVKDAEKYKAEDEEYRQMVSGKNKLEDLAYNMRNVIEEEPVASELSAEDKERINKAVDYALKLVDETDFITVDELVKVEKDLTVFYTTISKIVQDLDARGNESERKTLKKDRFKVGASFVNGLISSVCSVIQVIQNM
ncbi:heat shock 70 kDa protein 18 isoform X1 [Arachis ipaensis]|uniref:heat shock 70 kDa protein 18 isoform X1 n=1 Tax=Arachis ipaensis TaxID=130454 RepID=UPI0007AF383A|nr:heat shock 70 kDa protein 18 isoform X1 [Arachis ipaensis]XP_025650417.1 heat shock 70 kDa protein 18-like isoform X1 [Arachis hypogaea]XP_025697143.1 heat shock 70 kDa protein 18-like isoform X1 [Arachis hypogaea]QHO09850.1 Heat shock cognate 70 kDa protein [Arachis hypogaea]